MFADLGFISDDFAIVADEAGVEVEDDVDEEEDVHDGVEDKHGDIRWVARCPGQLVRTYWRRIYILLFHVFWLKYVYI